MFESALVPKKSFQSFSVYDYAVWSSHSLFSPSEKQESNFYNRALPLKPNQGQE